MSPFTEAICDEILAPNIDVDELFTRVRRNVYSKYQMQVPASVNVLLSKFILHKELSYTDSDEEVYKFVKKYGDDYNDKYGYFHGDDLICIDAAQYINIGFLDAVGITITTNLPDNYVLLVKSNLAKLSDRITVKNGSIVINDAENISKITLGSAFIT